MKLIWIVIPLVLIGIVGISESFADDEFQLNISHLEISDNSNDIITETAVGNPILITSEIKNNNSTSIDYTVLYVIKDTNNVQRGMASITDSISGNSLNTSTFFWTPLIAGEYTVTCLIWKAILSPIDLANAQTISLIVTEQDSSEQNLGFDFLHTNDSSVVTIQNTHLYERGLPEVTKQPWQGRMTHIISNIVNTSDELIPFTNVIQIENDQQEIVYYSYVSAYLIPQKITESWLSWIPQDFGSFTIKNIVLEGINQDEFLPISEHTELEIMVTEDPTFVKESGMFIQKSESSPKQQMKTGILPTEVECKVAFKLIFKSSDNSPACVKIISAYKLYTRGWNSWPVITENHSIVLTAEKSAYQLGEPVIVTLKNIGSTLSRFSTGSYGLGVLDDNDKWICCEATDLSVQLKPNEEFAYTWTQGSDSRYADPGEYKVTTTYTTPEGKGELSVPITITNQRYVIGDMANVVLSTDKPSYDIGEKIIITMKNIGNSTALYPAVPIGFWIIDEHGKVVLTTQGIFEAVGQLQPNKPIIYEWDQINENTSELVTPGQFTITTYWNGLKSFHSFTIN